MVSAIVVVIATITAIAKIAFEDRSLLAIFLLLVTILQVLEFEKKKKSWSYPVSSAMEKPLHGLGVSLRWPFQLKEKGFSTILTIKPIQKALFLGIWTVKSLSYVHKWILSTFCCPEQIVNKRVVTFDQSENDLTNEKDKNNDKESKRLWQ